MSGVDDSTRDRAAGVLLGQAVGDALGVPYEFATPLRADQEPDMIGGGLGPYEPGEWSDDTQMALCIAEVSATGADLTTDAALDSVAERFLGWLDGGASDVGMQTRRVLDTSRGLEGSASHRLRRAASDLHASTGRTAGNGGLMRTAVVGLTDLGDRHHTASAARAVAELTHADPLAGDSCVLWSEAVRLAVVDHRLDLAAGLDLIPQERRGQWSAWISDATGTDPTRFARNGFTVTALQTAWAAITSTSADDATHLARSLAAAIRAGDDTDTTAAIAGGLLGAYWGASAVPGAWRDKVHGWPGADADHLVRLALSTAGVHS